MSGFDPRQAPKTRPMSQKRTALVASLDIGTSKIACMIARLKPCPPNEALRGRSHAVELIGYSQIQSRGVKAGRYRSVCFGADVRENDAPASVGMGVGEQVADQA